MRSKLFALTAGAAVLAASSTGAAATGPSAATASTLVVIDHNTNFRLVDLPPAGNTAGDYFLARGTLTTRAGRRVGFHEVQCTVFFRDTIRCIGSFIIDGKGQIVADGVEGRTGQPDLIAVVGGTGQYAQARGDALVTPLKNAIRFTFRFTTQRR